MEATINANPPSGLHSPEFTDVVIVNDTAFVNGGAAQIALSSAIALARAGIRVTVLAAVGPHMDELGEAPNLNVVITGQYDILSDPSRLRAATQGIWNVQAARIMSRTLDALNPARTIVHFHGWTKALSASVLRETTAKKFPAIITLHEYFTACPIGSFYNHQRGEVCRRVPLTPACIVENCDARSYRDKLWRVARQVVQRHVAMVPDEIQHYITLSDLSESILLPALPASAKLYRVNNPIDSAWQPRVNPEHNDDFVYVGRLSPEKGAVLFAHAARQAQVKPVFVGDGECADEIRRCNRDAEVTGWLTREKVVERIARARALVFPSLWYETSGLVISEAAALGVASVVSDISVARERVIDGFTGLHFHNGDVKSLASALKTLKNDDVVRRLGSLAYEGYWKAPQKMERHISDLIQVYNRVVAIKERVA